jgi:hypothetical protein
MKEKTTGSHSDPRPSPNYMREMERLKAIDGRKVY